MIVFADNDILYKLAAWDLLPLLTETIGAKQEQVRVLDTLRYILRKPPKYLSKYGEQMPQMLARYIDGLPLLAADDFDECETLPIDVSGIDEGERVLLAATSTVEANLFFVSTGDKNMMRSLAGAAGYETVTTRVRGRLVCVEQVLWLGMVRHGCEYIRARIALCPDCDKAVKIIFGSDLKSPEPQVENGFLSYVRSLQAESRGLLHQFELLPSLD